MKDSIKDYKCAETSTECLLGLWEIGGRANWYKSLRGGKKKDAMDKKTRRYGFLEPGFSYLEMYPKDSIRNTHGGVQSGMA